MTMPERLAAVLGVILFLVVVWGIWQVAKARHRIRLQGRNAGVLAQEGKNSPVLLVFTAPYCSICHRKQKPAVQEIAQDLREGVSVKVVDVTSQPELAAQFGVMAVPSSVVIDASGNVQAMNHGFASAEKLGLQLQQVLALRT